MNEFKAERIFGEFDSSTNEEWKDKIIKELKGVDYSKLIWKSPEGIEIKPFYTRTDLDSVSKFDHFSQENNSWDISPEIFIEDEESANLLAIDALKNGANAITFVLLDKTRNDRCFFINESEQLSKLLKDLPVENIKIRFTSGRKTPVLCKLIEDFLSKQGLDPKKAKFILDYDPIDFLTIQGRFFDSEENDFLKIAELIDHCSIQLPQSRILGISGYLFHNAGATLVQELAFSLAIASEYLSILSEKGISIQNISKQLTFNFGLGSVYFMEIAKLRASRFLYNKLLNAFDPECSTPMFINSVSSEFNKSTCDPYTNLLRNTTEAMSAIIGGTDSLSLKPFDSTYSFSTDFSNRLARNIQSLLKDEVHLDKVIDPSAGSYFIENLTQSFIEETWNLFLKIEEQGGYIKAFKEGWIQQQVKESQNKRKDALANRKEILLGVNQFPDLNEKLKSRVTSSPEKRKPSEKEKIAEPIKVFRAAEEFENLRLTTENLTNIPKVFLFTYGNLAHRKARAFFTTNFFGCAGFEIIDNPGFSTIEEGISAVKESNSEIIVICSSDEEYVTIVPVIAKQLNKDKILVVAGYPKEHIESFKSYGVDHFIHARSNILESLKTFQELIKQKSAINK